LKNNKIDFLEEPGAPEGPGGKLSPITGILTSLGPMGKE